MMRREGFELQVSRPEIVTKEIDGVRMEPVEELVIDVPEDFQGVVIATLGARKGVMTKMVNHGSGRVRLEFRIPDARADRLPLAVPHRHQGHRHHEPPVCRLGAVARPDSLARDRGAGGRPRGRRRRRSRSTTCRSAARSSSSRRLPVYEGMIIGENARVNDLDVNVTKEKKQTNMRASSADEAIRLIPPRKLGLEQAIEFINDDELVEVTPKNIRLRKRILAGNMRPKRVDD